MQCKTVRGLTHMITLFQYHFIAEGGGGMKIASNHVYDVI